ncbi:MAG: PAC2 family protein, partial [Dehalococcoidales bacterium]|nr:PAC2 family protein [Dehalococcoidales bacterium]
MDESGNVMILERPKLRQPYMVCGLSGWVDGGESASGSARYLIKKLKAQKFAEIPIAPYHIFQMPGELSQRPKIKIENGLLKEHRFPQNQFYYAVNPDADNDLILYLGMEPNLKWEEHAEAILSVANEFSVTRIYLLGGVLDKTPHTREPGVSCACSSVELREEMLKYYRKQNKILDQKQREAQKAVLTDFVFLEETEKRAKETKKMANKLKRMKDNTIIKGLSSAIIEDW